MVPDIIFVDINSVKLKEYFFRKFYILKKIVEFYSKYTVASAAAVLRPAEVCFRGVSPVLDIGSLIGRYYAGRKL